VNIHLIENEANAARETAPARGNEDFASYAKRFMVGTPASIRARLEPLVEAGADYIIAYMPRVAYDQTPVRRFAQEIIPHFA
jgi:alkanesulfonate monooxygenase SsuD/methylene tetrahydromethanopterin reductase-like flavin-dependent oxidoreductase (luciferase family)